MNRIFILIVVAIAVGTSFVFAAPPTGKSLYSSRRADSPSMMPSMAIQDEVAMPLRGQVAPRQAPAIPSVPQLPTAPLPSPLERLNEPPKPEALTDPDDALELPLTGIKPPVPAEPSDDPAREEGLPRLRSKPIALEDAPTNQELAIDDFNARLAKIQLEKHNLNETLDLIEKIKNPATKVKTLVDLAEYVSRDRNYRSEAEQLYALAIDGIDALTKNKPIAIKRTTSMPSSRSAAEIFSTPARITSPTPEVKPTDILSETPRRSTLTLIEEAPPKANDKVEEPKPSTTPLLNGLNLSPLPTHPPTMPAPTPTLPATLPSEKEKVAEPKPVDAGLNLPPLPKEGASSEEELKPTRRPMSTPKRQIILLEEPK